MPAQSKELGEAEEADCQRCRIRLQHLVSAGLPPKEQTVSWNRSRLDRLLADHLMRSGYAATASQLADECQLKVHLTPQLIEVSACHEHQVCDRYRCLQGYFRARTAQLLLLSSLIQGIAPGCIRIWWTSTFSKKRHLSLKGCVSMIAQLH